MTKPLRHSILLMCLALQGAACLSRDAAIEREVEEAEMAPSVDPHMEMLAREQAAKPIEAQSPEIRRRFAEAKRLTFSETSATLSQAIVRLETTIDELRRAGAPQGEIDGLQQELAALRVRARASLPTRR